MIASLVISQNENVQEHETGGLALQKKKKYRKNSVDWTFHKK